uniref:LytR/AlgR family response regulator transcription factor n=1 Tax=Acetatifactor sp. TaxID=1872090 RepID=UPI0040571746
MTYKIAICDDNETDCSYISSLVFCWAEQYHFHIKLDTFSSAEAFLFHYAEQKNYDMLLLDIEMGEMDGVTMARKIRRENDSVQIVFITGYSDYIFEGYEVSALHYLMKPVSQEKLFEVLKRATEKLQRNERVLYLEVSGEMIRIPFYEIRYLEVCLNYVTIYGKQTYTVKKTLSEFASELDERFFRAGRSYLINLSYIQKVTKKEIHLTDNTVIPLSRGLYEPLNRAIIAHTD